MVIYEHVFDDTTGIRLVTKPNEKIGKETIFLQLRVHVAPNTVKMLSLELFDKDRNQDLGPDFLDAILQHKIKDIGKQCEKCGRYFLPHSPNQKKCDKCKEDN